MVTTQTADNVLKSYYLSAVTDQLNKSVNPLFSRKSNRRLRTYGAGT